LQLKEIKNVTDDGINAFKGLALPRVALSDKNQLYPMFLNDPNNPASGANDNYAANKAMLDKSLTGLIVYNIIEDDDKELCLGLNQWDGEKWNCFSQKTPVAVFEIVDCSNDISVFGSYENTVPLNGSNFLRITVNVTKAGSYCLSVVSDVDNGYFFQTSGEFLATGTFQITVPGMGIPVKFGTDHFTVLINDKAENSNGNPPCTFDIDVKDTSIRPRYGMVCSLSTLFGDYYEEQRLNNTHYIEVTLEVESGSYGAEWEIHTNEVDGIKFSGKGTLGMGSPQVVRIYGEGVPFDTRDKQFYIMTNSESTTATCQVTVFMIIPPKRVMTIGLDPSTYGYNFGTLPAAGNPNHSNRMLTDPNNFGPYRHSIVRYAGFTNRTPDNAVTATGVDHGGSIVSVSDAVSTTMTAARFSDYLFGRTGHPKIDMVIIGYNTSIFSSGTGFAAKADSLVKFMQEGGIVLMFCEVAATNQNLLRKVFNDNNVTVTAGAGAGSRSRLGYDGLDESMRQFYAKNDDPILVGPFANIVGSLVGEDASTTYFADNLPMDKVVLYAGPNEVGRTGASRSNTGAVIFRHQTLPFVWSGDGGFNSSNNGNYETQANENICPFKLQSRTINGQVYPYYPTYRRNFGGNNNYVYNAVFTANAIAWCIQKSEELRKAGK
jgi:hypothetical protein